jgi:NAD+ synthase
MPREITDKIEIALAQLNPVAGDIVGNGKRAREARKVAAEQGADLLVFTELFITGYPPEDLILKPAFREAARDCIEELAKETADEGPALLIGTPWEEDGHVYNAVALLYGGKVAAVRFKTDLPNYGVFDEKRVFEAGPMPGPVNFRGIRIGVPICEDIWSDEACECLVETGAEILIVPNGSPYISGKLDVRMNIAAARVAENGVPLIYVNQVGGQDELVFDGASFALNANSELAAQLPDWEEKITLTQWARDNGTWRCEPGDLSTLEEGEGADYLACVTGLRDYVTKNGFPGVVLGLSGGVDSAICAAMSVDALGPEKVHCVMLPYSYTSDESLTDAAACANALGVRYDTLPIHKPVDGFHESLQPLFEGLPPDTAEENLQSRTRGTILMAISNKFGSMLVTTGNKSEVSVGYATLYGDMNGGFNPIKDLYKTQVYALSRRRNAHVPRGALGSGGVVIPENILTKAPTAELKENQTDQDSLPAYDVLDDILTCLVENEMPLSEIVARGHDKKLVSDIQRMLYLAEYKRRQSAPGVKITQKLFGRDRRYPITNQFREKI